jgi:phospholipid/cholesterol/gamma-HCH transport system permease protein
MAFLSRRGPFGGMALPEEPSDDEADRPPRLAAFLWETPTAFLAQLGEVAEFFVKLVVVGVRRPVGFWGDVREQMFETLRSSWLVLIFSTFAFGFSAPGLQGATSFQLLGMQDRLGTFFAMSGVRAFTPWLNAIVIAGIAGTRLISDLGTRRVRQEFDAMEVMGIDPVHDVVLPRVIGLTVMTGLLSVLATVCGIASGVLAAVLVGSSMVAFLTQFWNAMGTVDVLVTVAKAVLFGLVISVVCGYKGYRAEGGPSEVGRAVNHGVVAAFAGVWVVNLLVSSLVLGLNPTLASAR